MPRNKHNKNQSHMILLRVLRMLPVHLRDPVSPWKCCLQMAAFFRYIMWLCKELDHRVGMCSRNMKVNWELTGCYSLTSRISAQLHDASCYCTIGLVTQLRCISSLSSDSWWIYYLQVQLDYLLSLLVTSKGPWTNLQGMRLSVSAGRKISPGTKTHITPQCFKLSMFAVCTNTDTR